MAQDPNFISKHQETMAPAIEDHDVTAALFDSLGGEDHASPTPAISTDGEPSRYPDHSPLPNWGAMDTAEAAAAVHEDDLEGMFMELDERKETGSGSASPIPSEGITDNNMTAPSVGHQSDTSHTMISEAAHGGSEGTPVEVRGGPDDGEEAQATAEDTAEADDLASSLLDSLAPTDKVQSQTAAGSDEMETTTDPRRDDDDAAAGEVMEVTSAAPETSSTKEEAPSVESATQHEVRMCVVCGKEPGKYKCTMCSAPFCSIACNRTHKENHPPVEKPAVESSVPSKRKAEDDDPYSPLAEHAEDFHQLFKKYPDLGPELGRIADMALAPPGGVMPVQHSKHQKFNRKPRMWTKEEGLRKAANGLRKVRTDGSVKGEAMREFCNLWGYLISQSGNNAATHVVREKVTAGDAKVIEQLMAEEQDKD